MAYCTLTVYVSLAPEVHGQMFRSGGQSDVKPPVLSSQASLVLIYRPTEGMKGRIGLAQPELDRGRIVAYRDCGLSFRDIGSRVGRNQTTVMRICHRWMQEGTMDRRGRSHPP
ncbi:transposable element Tcb1 transposase [Trichonephila clavipes]|nr:transposable element Tcb1 transposase [Trichonephila clavipes]